MRSIPLVRVFAVAAFLALACGFVTPAAHADPGYTHGSPGFLFVQNHSGCTASVDLSSDGRTIGTSHIVAGASSRFSVYRGHYRLQGSVVCTGNTKAKLTTHDFSLSNEENHTIQIVFDNGRYIFR